MIIISHNNKKVVKVSSNSEHEIDFDTSKSISFVLKEVAIAYPKEIILWYDECFEELIDFKIIPDLFHHNKMMMSYLPSENNFLHNAIGFVDLSIFIKINKQVKYPTWQMSATVGVMHASLMNSIESRIKLDDDFDYFLNSTAKQVMPLGIFCYSEPKLLKKNNINNINYKNSSLFVLFRFVKQHYKISWLFLLLLNLIIYKNKVAFFPLINSLFFKKRKLEDAVLDDISFVSNNINNKDVKTTIDVIIPTIGRKQYLYDVLKDLAKQSLVPKNIIIVEQNPNKSSISDLSYLTKQDWPFKIKHSFIHKTGVCNARNIALEQIESEWVFLADDDIRFENNFLINCFKNVKEYKQKAITLACLRLNDTPRKGKPFQWEVFGSGCSFVNKSILEKIKFNIQYEFGFGEDAEFGMQIRNTGTDVIFFNSPSLLHLKATIGGFRYKHVNPWDAEIIKPKPSPTVMLFETMNKTTLQVFGYKTMLFIKYYTMQEIKNPFSYFKMFQKQWIASEKWSNYLKESC